VYGTHFEALEHSAVRAGALKHFVTFTSQTVTTDNAGGRGDQQTGWARVTDAYASIRPLSGTERARSEQVGHERSHQVLVRYIPNFSSAWRMQWGTRIFRVSGFTDVNEAQRYLVIDAVEVWDDRA
jgi:SPP1 family predicted phage head-tail adaptor